jgi:acyl-[acyl-carrier-protein]-phospholipid O-acyltransferase/long-chain-fatty-acid--[acyl-carrier-protein] ligase
VTLLLDILAVLGWGLLGLTAALALTVLLAVVWPRVVLPPLLWLVTHSIYWLRVTDRHKIPATGPALLVCNHVSYIDWFLLRAASPRPIRFIVWAGWTRHRILGPLLRWTDSIPIDGQSGPRAIVKSLRAAGDALKAGEVVCIFAEGCLTRTGFMLRFHRGFEQIVKHAPVPIVPVCLDHMWGSVFSYRGGKVLWKAPLRLPYPVAIAFGDPMPPTANAAEVRLAVQQLSADCAIRSTDRRTVHRQFMRIAAKYPLRSCFIDTTGLKPRTLSYGKACAAAMLLAKWLSGRLDGNKLVGVWLPSSVGGALANIALSFLGRTTVNLNYTAGEDALRSAIKQSQLRQVVTSKRFLERMPFEVGEGVELILLEDAAPTISAVAKTLAFLKVLLLPGWLLDRLAGLHRHSLDDVATIIFSSGSTGEPKGVMLSHRNIAANTETMASAIDVNKHDRLLGVLPFFHSFGYTVTFWTPMQVGASAVYHPDPRQAEKVGELCRAHECTIFLGTATFLRFYMRKCKPDDFRTLRLLVCGAEKLPVPLAKDFDAKFGVMPLEGYGCTELSPVVAANVPDREVNGVKQIGNKPGTVGQPLPGVSVRIDHPETGKTLPPGEEGLVLVRGANVMIGYLGRPDLTAEKVRGGWYDTGDVGRVDEDGFLTLTGRLSRFAKIAGEMIPLERVEEELQAVLGTSERLVAVTAVPDEKRGERIVVLHLPLPEGTDVRSLAKGLGERGLPNLWVPGERDFFGVKELPILGTGKPDLRKIRQTAIELTT